MEHQKKLFSELFEDIRLIFTPYNGEYNDAQSSKFLCQILLHLLSSPSHPSAISSSYPFERLYFYPLPIPVLCAVTSQGNKAKLFFAFGPLQQSSLQSIAPISSPSLHSISTLFSYALHPFVSNHGIEKIVLSGVGEGNTIVQSIAKHFPTSSKIVVESISIDSVNRVQPLQALIPFALTSIPLYLLTRKSKYSLLSFAYCAIPAVALLVSHSQTTFSHALQEDSEAPFSVPLFEMKEVKEEIRKEFEQPLWKSQLGTATTLGFIVGSGYALQTMYEQVRNK